MKAPMTNFPTATFSFVFEENERKSGCRKIGCRYRCFLPDPRNQSVVQCFQVAESSNFHGVYMYMSKNIEYCDENLLTKDKYHYIMSIDFIQKRGPGRGVMPYWGSLFFCTKNVVISILW